MKILYFNPFSIEKDFLKELDFYMNMVPQPQDWACFRDGDTMFVRGDYGNCIMDYANRYPETGLFTSFASRCHYKVQVPPSVDMNNTSLEYHTDKAYEIHDEFQRTLEVAILKRRIAGHLMMIRKSTWLKIRPNVFSRCRKQNKKILGVDTQISYAILAAGFDIKMMKGIYLVHNLRLKQGMGNNSHLL